MTLTFFTTSLLIALSPGPGTMYTISTGLTKGIKKSILAAIGCTIGIIPHLILGVLGAALLGHVRPVIFSLIQFFGAVYLLTIGLRMYQSPQNLASVGQNKNSPDHEWSFITQPVLLNLLNPKLSLFFLSFLPQFVARDSGDTTRQAFILGLVFMVLTLVVFILYGLLASRFHTFIMASAQRLNRIQKTVAIGFIIFAFKLFLDIRMH